MTLITDSLKEGFGCLLFVNFFNAQLYTVLSSELAPLAGKVFYFLLNADELTTESSSNFSSYIFPQKTFSKTFVSLLYRYYLGAITAARILNTDSSVVLALVRTAWDQLSAGMIVL